MKRLLGHGKTKMELTEYLSAKTLQKAESRGKNLVVAWGVNCQATQRVVTHLRSSQEEADTKMLLHAVDAAVSGATEINICSPDTDVFILSLRRYPELCDDVSFVTGTGVRHRAIKLKPIVQALGSTKVAALPALHAMSGADVTGCFAGKAKLTWWKIFKEADEGTIAGLADLGTTDQPTTDTMAAIEKLVCQLYVHKTEMTKVKELRWWLFRKRQAQSEKLPPTQEALRQAIMRANHQAMVWDLDTVAEPQLPSPEASGWKLEGDEWVPVMTSQLPAPEAVIQLVKCGCSKSRCSTNRCNCRRAKLNCTDLCSCSDSNVPCDNQLEDDDDFEEDAHVEYESDESDS